MRQALELALDALTYIHTETSVDEDELIDKAITAIKEALAQPEQEPLCTAAMFDDAFLIKSGLSPHTKLYTAPPQRTWVGLTDEEILAVVHYSQLDNAKAIEAKFKKKNGYAEEKNT